MADDCCSRKGDTIADLAAKADQRLVLILVMVINFVMFIAEFGGGLAARSSALMADSVDMFGDALVYALSLYALHRGWQASNTVRKSIASINVVLERPWTADRQWRQTLLDGRRRIHFARTRVNSDFAPLG